MLTPVTGSQAARTGHGHAFELLTCWQFDAPPQVIWAALTHPDAWPNWWPHVHQADRLAAGNTDGLGAVHRLRWGSRLAYGLTLTVRSVEVDPPRRLHVQASGDLEGTGIWQLQPTLGGGTRADYLWRVDLTRRWMRRIAPLAAPLFRWNHDAVMHAGAIGLARHLGVRLISDGAVDPAAWPQWAECRPRSA